VNHLDVGLAARAHRMVIGNQNGPTSASKTDPPGFMGTLGLSQVSWPLTYLLLSGGAAFEYGPFAG